MKKILKVMAITSLLSISMTSATFAGSWKQDENGWRWQDGTKACPYSTWKWIDSDGDDMAECYYFDENGYILTGTTTPDGCTVNESGAWTDQGIVRQKASNPSAAQAINLEGLELYQAADQKSSQLAGMDIKADIQMNFSYLELNIPISMNMLLKYHDLNTPVMEYLNSATIEMMGIQKSETYFYTNGCYYSDGGQDEKYKMKIGYGDMTNKLTMGGLTGEFDAFLDNMQIADDEAGNKILFYSSSKQGLEHYLHSFYDEIWPSLADSDMKIDQINGKAVISPEGYFLKEAISLYMTITEDGESMGMTMDINVDYSNPGQPVNIQFPSLEGFEELVY